MNKMNKNKSFVVITGASSGIGQSTALDFARKGQSLVLIARRKDRLQALKKRCLKLGSLDVEIVAVDLTRSETVEKAVKSLLKKIQSVSVLINSAGLASGVDLFPESKKQDVDVMIDTNIKSVMHLSRLFLPLIIKNQGHVVNLGSVAGRIVYEGGSVYCATKFAIRAWSDGLRMDLKGTGVRVTNIEPGMVNTEFSLVRLGSQQKADAVYENMMPLSASDVSKTILWCVEQPGHVNIQELVIYPTDQASVGQVVRGEKSIKNLIKNKVI